MTQEELQQLSDEAAARYNIAKKLCNKTIVDLNTQQVIRLDYGFIVDKNGIYHYHGQYNKDDKVTFTHEHVNDLVATGVAVYNDHILLAFDIIQIGQIALAIYNQQNND